MSTTMTAVDLPLEEPIWLFHGPHDKGAPAATVAGLLERLDQRDFTLMVLTYGLGMRVGAISRATKLDPAIVVWRLNDVFIRFNEERDEKRSPAPLERALRDLLRDESNDAPAPPKGCASWQASELVSLFDKEVQQRLEATIKEPDRVEKRQAGLGIGLAFLIGLGSLTFLGYGVIREINVMMRGHTLMRTGNFEDARSEFKKESTLESTKWIIVSLLAEGRYEEALGMLTEPNYTALFGAFEPTHQPVSEDVDHNIASRAVLPRGLMINPRPEFIVRAGPPAEIELEPVALLESNSEPLPTLRWVLPDSRDHDGQYVTVPFPKSWPSLQPGRYVWRVDDGAPTGAAFDLVDQTIADGVRDRNWTFLTRQVPIRAQNFLRGHHFLNAGLAMQAGRQFGKLANEFPTENYPRQQIWRIAETLGVDPAVFLR
ncbi:MAG: hypothetical protein ACI9EF_002452 [Pseudohongiellaceae bacterium]|jgi:hypothetical protein